MNISLLCLNLSTNVVSDLLVKMNFKPYVLLLDLMAAVDPETVVVKIMEGVVHLVMTKVILLGR